jgi:hypothetical protein
MANVKFKSGSKDNISTTPINAGTVYFAIDSEDKGSIYFDKDSSTRVLMSEAYAEYAETANKDASNQVITDTYIKDITFASATDTSDNKIKVIATLTKGSGNTTTKRILPIAGPGLAGVITPEAQTIAGAKTFTGAATFSGGATFSNSAFNYSGIEVGTANSARVVWFADSSSRGKPVYDTDFTYNPSTNTLTATNFAGTATAATYDSSNQAITDYLYNVSLSDTTLTFTRGSGQTIPLTIQSGIIRRWEASA